MRLEPDRPDRRECYGHDLAVAVLLQAVNDAADTRLPEATREGARAFLRGGRWLRFWCAIADLDHAAVAERFRTMYPRRAAHSDRRAS